MERLTRRCCGPAGVKLINAFLLVRLGIAQAMSAAIWSSPKYGQAWRLKPEPELIEMHQQLVSMLKQPLDGPYNATCLLFGTQVADSIVREQGLFKGIVMTSTLTRKRDAGDSSDEVEEIDPLLYGPNSAERPKKRRRMWG